MSENNYNFNFFILLIVFVLLLVSPFSQGWLLQKERPRTHPCTYKTDSGVKVTGELTKIHSHLIVCLPLDYRTYSFFNKRNW